MADSQVRQTKKVAEYKAKAAECEQCARQVRDLVIRQHYKDLAAHWQALADQTERQHS